MFSFRSQITVKVLGYFFLHPTNKEYVNELARLLDVDPGNLDRKLKELKREGIVFSETLGKQKYYFLNKQYPFLDAVQKMYERSHGLVHTIKDILKGVKGITGVYLFGSFAKGNFDEESDVDLLVVGECSVIEVQKKIVELEKEIHREFNVMFLSDEEFQKRIAKKEPFVQNILDNNIKIL